MFPAKNSSNLRHEVFNNWLDSTKSTWKVLKENNRLIRGSLIYLSVSNPRNWLIKVTIHWVSSLKMFRSTWNGRFCSWTYCLKQLLKNYCFFSIANSLKYCTGLFTIFFRLQGELIRTNMVLITTKDCEDKAFLSCWYPLLIFERGNNC